MGPSKKPKCAHKRTTNIDDANSDKDLGHSRKHQQRRKRLYDKLGPRWNEQEIECFYDTFRKYGCDWKKVAVVIRTRSREMIEALYLMNRAYLSLPEGTATVRGLIAMMVDHYDAQMDGTESDRESNDVSCIYQKVRKGGNNSPGSSKDLLQCQSVSSGDGCLSFLKRKQSAGRAVGKRTPRFPVSFSHKNSGVKTTAIANPGDPENENLENTDDEHVAALALTEASQRGGSPQLSQTPCGRGRHGDEDSKHLRNVRSMKSLMDIEGAGTVEINLKASKSYGKRHECEEVDDYREVCSGTREDPKKAVDGEVMIRKKSKQIPVAHPESEKKHEISAFHALETLADLSLTASTIDPDLLPARLPKKASVPEGEATSTDYRKVLHSGYDTEVPTSKRRGPESKKVSESKLQSQSSESLKRKRKIMPAKMIVEKKDRSEAKNATEDEGNSPASRNKRGCHSSPPVREPKSAMPDKETVTQAVSSFSQYSERRSQTIPSPVKKYQSRRKIKKRDESDEQRCSVSSQLKDDASSCLSSRNVRRWCVYEWFYSATDYPWFARNEFVEYLHHAGLGHIPRLTRVEWGVIRSSLGKPRRFSERFLEEEKDKVRQYREAVRKHYTELRAGISDGLPTDLARPLFVGQRVIAVHPKSRDVHDGSVLTVDHDRCRIQFDRPELGVEFVMDVDCMPANPLENMPESIKRQKASLVKLPLSSVAMASPVDADTKAMAGGSSNSMTGAPPPDELNQADLQSLTELNWALDKKELLLVELREANDGMVRGQRSGDLLQWKESQLFKRHYATILVELKEASDQVSSAVRKLRDRNTYHPLLGNCNGHHHDSAAGDICEIVRALRANARAMVEAAAVSAMASGGQGEDAFGRVSEALARMSRARNGAECGFPASHSAENRARGMPLDLITSCLSALMMVQACTERQYPPADVAKIIDSAITSLRPSCSQNLPIFRDIEMCMGRIKMQILALVPTDHPSPSLPL